MMREIVNREAQDYLSIVDEYYSSEAISGGQGFDREKVLLLLSDKLKSAWHDADMAADRWSDLVMSIKSKPWVRFARNWKRATPQAYKLIVGIESGNDDIPCSIVVFVSFIGNQIGMLYVDMLAGGTNDRPFYEHSRTLGNSLPVPFVSYSTMNKLHEKYAAEILGEVSKFFPGFTFFDNQFADYKIKGIQTEEDYYADIDLFMIFFERGLPSGIPT